MTAVQERVPNTVRGAVRPGSVLDPGGLVLTSDDADSSVRWSPGDRLHHVFEQRCDALAARGDAGRLAVGRGALAVSYADLDARANRLARFLLRRGLRPGDRVGLVFDEPLRSYVAMLAVLKCHAAYVPLDVGFPPDRIAYICGDAGASTVLTVTAVRDRLGPLDGIDVVRLDEVDALVAAEDPRRPDPGQPVDDLCYVVYTSGTTGRPKGVAIEHASICNFVRVAAEVYGVRSDDRMYQGMTIAFDFSVEEIWVALAVGATLVPRPGAALLGDDLARFLRDEDVTALCCVPTLLATMTDDLPDLRFLLVSGEACPQDLVARWHRPDRRFLNVYGPTEATVTATWTTLHPDRPVTIGVPLPTYSVVILDERDRRPLPAGEVGEIGIAGICLARGYLGRDDLTARAFLDDVPGVAPTRVYRTGDLGRITPDGQVEYLGRIDTQVKIRGYRIELTEIESLLLALPGIGQAVVDLHEPTPGATELVAYFTPRRPGGTVDVDAVHEALRARLPRYMVPAYFEQLDRIPMLPSDKADRKNLPPPTRPRRASVAGEHVDPADAREEALAGAVAALLGAERVSVTAQLFDELGLNSLLMAQLCTRLREHPDLPPVTMREVYQHPTVRELAAALPAAAPRRAMSAPRAVRTASTVAYLACGAVQAASYLALSCLLAWTGVTSYGWMAGASGFGGTYLRAVAVGAALFVVLSLLPVVAKWLLIGRFRPGAIPVWTGAYLRFWAVRQLLRATPARALIGSPLWPAYLRLLGARVGPGAVVLSATVPTCPDLVSIGAGAVVRKDAFVTGYRAESGWIRTGRVEIGAGADVGETTVLDVDTALGDGARLGHASSLQAGQRVPAGRRWHGTPAQDAGPAGGGPAPRALRRRRRVAYGAFRLATLLLGWAPLLTTATFVVLPAVFPAAALVLDGQAAAPHDFADPAFHLRQFLVAGALLFGTALLGLGVAAAVPRVLSRLVPPGRAHPLYGLRYSAYRTAARLSNVPFFHNLLGDSSFIVGYLRAIGYDLSRVQQTGSNFGLVVKHDSPSLSHIGSGTLVSDGLSIVNADWSSSSFTLARTSLGAGSFVGNAVTYPAGGRTGDDCLLATKVMVPTDGPVREGVGLLGSPPFEIPRSVQRDADLERYRTGPFFARRLAAKNRSNLLTIALFLLQRWLQMYGLILIGLAAADLYPVVGFPAFALGFLGALVFTTLFAVFTERCSIGFRRLRPRFCSIYQPYFWTHERLWKLSGVAYLHVFDGTPFKSVLWRLLGVRVGRRLFDDGATIPEKTMVTIGDDCTLGAESTIQCHSLEDGAFKSDRIVLGDGVTVGAHTYVHYGVSMGDRGVLDPDAFLMKGTSMDADARWSGNPAREIAELTRSAPARLRLATGRVLVLAAAVPLVGAAVLAALGTAAGAAEARLVDAAFAALRPSTVPAVPVGLDELAARVQLSGYAALTGAFGRHAHVLTGARELALLAAAVLLVAVVALARSLGVRPWAMALGLLGLAVCPPAVAVLTTFGAGLLGAAWLTAGAALLARNTRWQHVLAVPAVVAGVVSAPVLAVPLLVVGAAYLVAVRARRRGPLLLGVAVVATALPLALLPAPGGAAAVPALLVVAVLVGLVLVDEAGSALARRSRRVAVATGVVLGAVALAVAGVPAPAALARVSATVDGAPGFATWLAEATDPATGVAAPAGVWADLVRAGVPSGRLRGGPLTVTAAGDGPALARFGQGTGALAVTGPVAGSAGAAGGALAANPNLDAPEEVRATLRAGAVDPRAVAVLASLAARGPVTVEELAAVAGEDPAVPRHRVVLADVDAQARALLAAQQPPYVPIVVEGAAADADDDDVAGGAAADAGAETDTDGEAAEPEADTEDVLVTLTWPLPAG